MLTQFDAKTLANIVVNPYNNKHFYNSDTIIQAALDLLYPEADQALLREQLQIIEELTPINAIRLQCAVLLLCKGDPTKIERYIQSALLDYRDVLYWCQMEYKS